MADFKDTLKAGEAVEQEFIDYLNSLPGIMAWKFKPAEKRQLHRYDICTNKDATYEVKRDFESQETGNACFELFTRHGHKVGILRTWANFFVTKYEPGGNFYLATPYKITLFLMGCPKVQVISNMGDRNYMGVVVPKDLYINQPFITEIKWPGYNG